MVSISTFQEMARSFDEITESPHFEKHSFRIRNKIFATVDTKEQLVCLKLSEVDQSVYCEISNQGIYAVPNAWGKQGWTYVALKKVKKPLMQEMLTKAYCNVAPSTLARRYSG